MRLTLLTLALLTLAGIAHASPIVGESLREGMVRQRFEDQLEDMQHRQSTDAERTRELLEENAGKLDDIRRQLEEQENPDR